MKRIGNCFKTDKGVKIVGVPEMYRDYGLHGKVILEVDGGGSGRCPGCQKSFWRDLKIWKDQHYPVE